MESQSKPQGSATPSVSIPRDLLQRIDAEAKGRGWERSFLIREAVREWFFSERMRGRLVSEKEAS